MISATIQTNFPRSVSGINRSVCDIWLEHSSFGYILRKFFCDAGDTDGEAAQGRVDRVLGAFRDGTMRKIFEEIGSVIDSGGLSDLFTESVDLYKYFDADRCAENNINLTCILYAKLCLIVQHYFSGVLAGCDAFIAPEWTSDDLVEIIPNFSLQSDIKMVVICCMLLAGQGEALSATSTPYLLNSLLFMSTNQRTGSMPLLERMVTREVPDLYKLNWSIELLKIAPSRKREDIVSSMSDPEKKGYENLLRGEKITEALFKRLRKLSIMMLTEGAIVTYNDEQRTTDVVPLWRKLHPNLTQGQPFRRSFIVRWMLRIAQRYSETNRVERFLQNAKSHNGLMVGPRRSFVQVWGARLYLFLTLGVSIYVILGKIGKRDSIFERLTDGLACITALWFSVSGIAKIQSDDENLIRNVVFGLKPIEHEDELVQHLDTDAETIKVAHCRAQQDFGWLSSRDCCYVKGKMKGKIEIPGGLNAKSCDRAVLLEADEVVLLDACNNVFGRGSKDRNRFHVDAWERRCAEKWLIVNRVPSNCVVARILCDELQNITGGGGGRRA